MIVQWLNNRAQEKSSQIGAIIAAVTAAANAAGALPSPWDYIVFAVSILLIVIPEK
jgi:hypothetical protein